MTTADQLNIVDRKLTEVVLAQSHEASGPHTLVDPRTGFISLKALCLAEAGLVAGWVKSRRLCVLVEERSKSPNTQALVVFNSTSFPVSKPDDLAVESVLAVDADFK